MHRSLQRPVLIVALGMLVLSGCTGDQPEDGAAGAAPELGLPETVRGSVTALDGGLDEQFTLTLEDLTGAAPDDCDEQGRCAILADDESPEGRLLVHAWHEDPERDTYLGLDSSTGEVVWSIAEEAGAVGTTHVSRHGPLLLGLASDAPGEDHSGYEQALLLDPLSGETITEVQIPESTMRLSALDTPYGIAVLALVMAEGEGPGDPVQELVVLGLGTDGTEHWRTSVDPGEDPDTYYSVSSHEDGIAIAASTMGGSTVHALLAADTGAELALPEGAAKGLDMRGLDIDDGSVEGFAATQDPETYETTVQTTGGEPWTVPRPDGVTGAISTLRGVCGGLAIVAEESPSGSSADLHVRAYDPGTGEERWVAPVKAQPSMLCADGHVLANDRTTAYLLDPGSGEFLESYELAPGAIPVPEDGQEHDVPRSLSLRSAATYTADASIVVETHEAGQLPQLSVYR